MARRITQQFVALLLIGMLVLPLQARYNAKPRWSLYSVDQEVQAGKEYSTQVEKEMPLLSDSAINNYVSRLGQRLAAKAPGAQYPYVFRVVNQKEINAFALPGGPVFINLGTIQAADNESQLAGVIAHEISHVVMRHSVNQASKQAMAQIPLAILGGRLGGGMVGQLAQLGIGFGVGSLFMKYSRDAEREADLVGADILYDAGYDPQGMVTFFRKLDGESGARGSDFFQSHPNPGNRADTVAKEIASLGRKQYVTDSAEFRNIKNEVAGMRPLTAQEIAARQKSGNMNGTGNGAISRSSDVTPSSQYTTLNHNAYSIQYPSNWEAYGDKNSTVTIAPQGGVAQNAVAYGVIINGFDPEQRENASLDGATHQLVQQIRQSNPELRQVGHDEDFTLNGEAAKSVVMVGTSPLVDRNNQAVRERDWMVVTRNRSGDVIYFVFIAPETDFQNLYPTYNKILRSVRLR